jgi:large conductance mechanosensitive channel
MKAFMAEFRKFIMRGNVIDLAVAVVIGVAFNAVIQSFVNDIINPIIGAIFGKPNFDELTFKIGDGVVRYGAFITALINFLIIGFALFIVVRGFTHLQTRLSNQSEEEAEKSEKDVLVEIRDLLASQQSA